MKGDQLGLMSGVARGAGSFRVGEVCRVRVAAMRFQQTYALPQPRKLPMLLAVGAPLPGIHLRVQRIANRAVERIGVSTFKHHAEIVTVRPILLWPELLAHTIVETRVWQRVGEGDTNIVRPRLANEHNGFLDVFPGFARISELEEIASADAFSAQVLSRVDNFLDLKAFVHCIQDLLGSGLNSHPDLRAPSLLQCSHGVSS